MLDGSLETVIGRQLLETVKAFGVVDLEAAVKPEHFKKEAVEEVKSQREKTVSEAAGIQGC